ncbi:MAG: tetratricopeptide repeat protein [Planctomycetota bacterium]|nr:tetratricopeptide repeat protein [Planctomycetota bacterium]
MHRDRSQASRSSLLAAGALAILAIGLLALGGWTVVRLMRMPAAATGAPPPGEAPDALTPQTIETVLAAARAYLSNGQPGSAEVILREAVTHSPDSQQLLLLLGETLMHLNRLDEAYDAYTKAVFIGPDHPEYRHVAGTIASALNRPEDAEIHFLKALSLNPSNPKYALYAAQVQRRLGKIDAARANLVVATKLDPSQATAWGSLAAIALDENRPSVALQYVAHARRLEPEAAVWRLLESKALRRDGRAEDALGVLRELPEAQRTSDPAVLEEMALCLGMLQRPADAARLYVTATAAAPDNPLLAYEAAVWLDRAGDRAQALLFARSAALAGNEDARRLVRLWEATP